MLLFYCEDKAGLNQGSRTRHHASCLTQEESDRYDPNQF
jgi:hypothetical protein